MRTADVILNQLSDEEIGAVSGGVVITGGGARLVGIVSGVGSTVSVTPTQVTVTVHGSGTGVTAGVLGAFTFTS